MTECPRGTHASLDEAFGCARCQNAVRSVAPAKTWKGWSDVDVADLTQHVEQYGTGRESMAVYERVTGRTAQSARVKAQSLGLKQKVAVAPVAEWQARRDAAMAEAQPATMAARLIGRVQKTPEFRAHETAPIQETTLEPVLIVPDSHIPYHSRAGWDLLLQVGAAIRPKLIVAIGDLWDCYSVSSHDKSPDRAHRLDEELDAMDVALDELDALGATDKVYIEGNHEDRLKRHLMKDAQLYSRRITTQALLRLDERGWEFIGYKDHVARGRVHFTHDVGASGRNANFRALDTYQHSVVSGHSHRFQMVVEGTAVGGCKIAASFGWLGDVDAVDYMNRAAARRSWALGFAVGYHDPSTGVMYLQPVPVVHGDGLPHTCCVNGVLYRSRAA